MNRFTTTIFPDICFMDQTFIKSCLIYFDHIIVPPININERRSAAEIRRGSLKLAEQFDMDLDTALERYNRATEIIRVLEEFEEEGIVKRSPQLSSMKTDEGFLSLTMKVINEIGGEDRIVTAASAEAVLWTEDSYFQISPRDMSKKGDSFSYIQWALFRLLSSLQMNYGITTNNLVHYKALMRIQKTAFVQPKILPKSSVVDAIRMAMPFLAVKDFQDILYIREKLKDFLEPFRVEICKLLADIPDDIADDRLLIEIQRVVERDIQPQISELSRYLASPQDTLKKHLVSSFSAMTTATVTIMGAVLTHANLDTLGIAMPFIHLLASSVTAKHEISERKRSNPFTFAVLAEQFESRR